MPLIYSGQEVGLNKRLSFFERDPIEWKEDAHSGLYATILNLKKKVQVMWNGESGGTMIRVPTSNDSVVFAFVREKESNKVFVIANLSDREQDAALKGSEFLGDYVDAFSAEKVSVRADVRMKLKAWGCRVFVE
jgi:glycosidase